MRIVRGDCTLRTGVRSCMLAALVGPWLWASAPASAGIVSFQGLGDLPGGSFESQAFGVSADGSVVVGWSRSDPNIEAFRWTSGGGMVGLGDLPGGAVFTQAFGVSADGSVVVGVGSSASGSEAFRWTSEGGMVGLGDLPGGFFNDINGMAHGVSADGSVVVGSGTSDAAGFSTEAFRWTAGGGMVGLGDLPGGIFSSVARGVSADGSVVVGASGTEAFRWTSAGGMVGLGDLPGGIFRSDARGVSADGSVVVGVGRPASGQEAFRWTAGGGMVGLGDLPGGSFDSEAFGVSADGSVVVGRGSSADDGEVAFLWDAANGMRSLQDVLVGFDLDMTGWRLTNATGVSADGLTIVGTGTRLGATEAWIAHLPEPFTCACDFNGDGRIDLQDHDAFVGCFGGSDVSPSPPPPVSAQQCLDAFDVDLDSDVDLFDMAAFFLAFGRL